MSLGINLLELQVDSLTRIEVFRRLHDNSSLIDEIREQLGPGQVVTRLGEKIWGHALPLLIVEKYGFSQAMHLFVALDPKLANRLIRDAVHRRLQQLGFRRVGYNTFEQPDEIAFTLGDEGELMAQPRWLVRPFSLPRGTENVFGLLVNPGLAYRFTINLQQLSDKRFDWSYFGDKIRAVAEAQVSQETDPWQVAHTVRVIEQTNTNRLLCEWRDGERQEVDLKWCWPLASTTNRYRYLKRCYVGFKGEQLAKTMKAKDDDFFALKNVHHRIEELAKLIGWVELGDGLKLQIGDFSDLTLINHQDADALQASLIAQKPEDMDIEDIGDETDEEELEVVKDLEEIVQLELF